MARIGYSVHLLQLAPPPAWSLAYLQAATQAVRPAPHPRGRPPPAGSPLTCRQVADLMAGVACASRPWHRMLRQSAEGAEGVQAPPPPTPMGRPIQPPSPPPPASDSAGPVFSPPAGLLLGTARPLTTVQPPPAAEAKQLDPNVQPGVQPGVLPGVQPGAELGSLDSALFSLGRQPAPFDNDDRGAEGEADAPWAFDDEQEGGGGAGNSSSGDGLRAAGLALAAQFAGASEPLVLEHARRMVPADLARCLEGYWRLGRPASWELLGVVQARGGALLRVCNLNQSNTIIQVSPCILGAGGAGSGFRF